MAKWLDQEIQNNNNTFLHNALVRAGNLSENLVKTGVDKALQRSGSAVDQALGALAIGGANTLINAATGTGTQTIPKQYDGHDDLQMQYKDFFDTYRHAQETFFTPTVIDSGYEVENSHPMMKSLFLVDFEFNTTISNDSRLSNIYPKSMTFLLKQFNLPSIGIETKKINSYNKFVIRPEKITYPAVTCHFTDIYTAYRSSGADKISLLDLMNQYLSYYFNDLSADGDNLHFGYSSDRTDQYFFKNITFYSFWSDGARKITLRNPFIKSFTYDGFDYQDDSPVGLSCDIDYEYIDTSTFNLTYDEFIQSAASMLPDIIDGFNSNVVANPNSNSAFSNPGQSPSDLQRSTSLDNAAAQTLLKLAENKLIDVGSKQLNSSNPLEKTVAETAVHYSLTALSTGIDIVGKTFSKNNKKNNNFKGLL